MSTNDAFDEGYDAYWDGVDVSGNPHEDDMDEYRSWEDGWRTARKDDYDDTGVQNGKGKRGGDDHHQGTSVEDAQNNLQKVGVYSDGAIDGWFYDKMLDAVKQFQDAATQKKFIINEVLTDIGEILSGHQKGEHCAKTQEYLKKVVDKGGKVPVKANTFDIDKAIDY